MRVTPRSASTFSATTQTGEASTRPRIRPISECVARGTVLAHEAFSHSRSDILRRRRRSACRCACRQAWRTRES